MPSPIISLRSEVNVDVVNQPLVNPSEIRKLPVEMFLNLHFMGKIFLIHLDPL